MPLDDPGARDVGDVAAPGELFAANWRKARRSGAENGGCVEIAAEPCGLRGIRDSRRPHDGVHLLSTAAFAAFVADAKAGVYDAAPERAERIPGG